MEFNMPTASRKRMEELLEYLGKTENYSNDYKGNRAEDFKKCFDIESPWCWKYADIVLRGLEKRKLGYSEGHHAVPRAFYGVKYNCRRIDDGNLFTLSYTEHVWAHYCAVYGAIGEMRGKMARAFITMYKIGICKKRPLMPSEAELLAVIQEIEIKRIQAMEPQWATVEAEGRTHHSEDPVQYRKDYYEANKEKLAKQQKARREANKEIIAEYQKTYAEKNKEKLAEYRKARREANKEIIAEYQKDYRKANKEKIAKQQKARREANKEIIAEYQKTYAEKNKEKLAEYRKARREANKEIIAEYQKDYRKANKEKIAEYQKDYRKANKEIIAEYKKDYRKANKEKIAEQQKTYHKANKEIIAEQKKAHYDAKRAAGYRYRKNPLTGKHEWVFVGLPESPKSTEVA